MNVKLIVQIAMSQTAVSPIRNHALLFNTHQEQKCANLLTQLVVSGILIQTFMKESVSKVTFSFLMIGEFLIIWCHIFILFVDRFFSMQFFIFLTSQNVFLESSKAGLSLVYFIIYNIK